MPLDSTTYVPSRQAELAEQARRGLWGGWGDVLLYNARSGLEYVLANARAEAPIWLAALRAGRVDGWHYWGDCCCLLGTIAKARGHDSGRFLSTPATTLIEGLLIDMRPGDTPENHPLAALVAEWTEDWLARNGGGV